MRKILVVVAFFALMFLVGGCVSFAPLVSEMETFRVSDQIEQKVAKPNTFDVAAEIGRELGFKAVRKGKGEIVLSSETPFLAQGVSPKFTFQVIEVRSNGGNIEIKVYTKGNFGTGGQKAAEELLQKFKGKLLEKLK